MVSVVHKSTQLHFASLDVTTSYALRARVDLLVINLDLAIFNQVVYLENLVSGLSVQLYIVVSKLIQIAVAASVQLNGNKFIGSLASREITQATTVVDHLLTLARYFAWVSTLQIESVDSIGHLRWPRRAIS